MRKEKRLKKNFFNREICVCAHLIQTRPTQKTCAEMRKTMEQLSLTAGKEKENVVQILTDLMEHNREFQIMITVPARAAGEENSLEYV